MDTSECEIFKILTCDIPLPFLCLFNATKMTVQILMEGYQINCSDCRHLKKILNIFKLCYHVSLSLLAMNFVSHNSLMHICLLLCDLYCYCHE